MSSPIRRFCVSAFLGFSVSILPFPACARAATPTTQPQNPINQSLLRFLDALDSVDAPALQQLIYVAENVKSHELGRAALIDLIVAERKLERVAAARFPNQPQRFRRSFELLITPAVRAALASAAITIDESQTAKITIPNETWPIRLRRAPSGQWQVVLDIIDSDLDDSQLASRPTPDPISRFRIERLHATAAAVDAVASRIEAGDFAEPLAAESDLLDRLAAAKIDYRNKHDALFRRSRQPSTTLPRVPD